MLRAALRHAGAGRPVLPLYEPTPNGCACGDPTCRSAGKHPRTRRGVHDATTDPERIRAWWARWPTANLGLATGRASGLWVLDVDVQAGGADSLGRLVTDHGPLPATLVARTGSGLHLYWRYPPDGVASNRVGVAPGLDIRTDGGFVVAPPSWHASGVRYQLLGPCSAEPPTADAPADAPAWLLHLLRPPPPPPPRPPAPPIALPPARALREARRRLNTQPDLRERAAALLGARIVGEGRARRAERATCPQCGRPSIWWAVHPERAGKATCAHKNSCGWSGWLDQLLGPALP